MEREGDGAGSHQREGRALTADEALARLRDEWKTAPPAERKQIEQDAAAVKLIQRFKLA